LACAGKPSAQIINPLRRGAASGYGPLSGCDGPSALIERQPQSRSAFGAVGLLESPLFAFKLGQLVFGGPYEMLAWSLRISPSFNHAPAS